MRHIKLLRSCWRLLFHDHDCRVSLGSLCFCHNTHMLLQRLLCWMCCRLHSHGSHHWSNTPPIRGHQPSRSGCSAEYRTGPDRHTERQLPAEASPHGQHCSVTATAGSSSTTAAETDSGSVGTLCQTQIKTDLNCVYWQQFSKVFPSSRSVFHRVLKLAQLSPVSLSRTLLHIQSWCLFTCYTWTCLPVEGHKHTCLQILLQTCCRCPDLCETCCCHQIKGFCDVLIEHM